MQNKLSLSTSEIPKHFAKIRIPLDFRQENDFKNTTLLQS